MYRPWQSLKLAAKEQAREGQGVSKNLGFLEHLSFQSDLQLLSMTFDLSHLPFPRGK
jgi:hypothetical protein